MITKVKYTRIWKKFTFTLCLSSQASSCNQAFKKNGIGAGAGGGEIRGDTLRSKIFIWRGQVREKERLWINNIAELEEICWKLTKI